jgi:myo-inositol-1(or 4)-monophosphatase
METAAPIALEAGALLRHFYARGVETEYKSDVDIVTEADRTSEKLLRERLAAAFPEHGVFGEEGTRDRMEGEYRWYIDPLDGTTNFAHGFPQFCVSMGLEHRPALLRRPTERWSPVSSMIRCAMSCSSRRREKAPI